MRCSSGSSWKLKPFDNLYKGVFGTFARRHSQCEDRFLRARWAVGRSVFYTLPLSRCSPLTWEASGECFRRPVVNHAEPRNTRAREDDVEGLTSPGIDTAPAQATLLCTFGHLPSADLPMVGEGPLENRTFETATKSARARSTPVVSPSVSPRLRGWDRLRLLHPESCLDFNGKTDIGYFTQKYCLDSKCLRRRTSAH